MTDPYAFDPLANARAALRMQFAATPRHVRERTARRHERLEELHIERAHALGRPPYREAPGFTSVRPYLSSGGYALSLTISGRERAYGPTSRHFWHHVGRAMREAFLSAWHDARGTEYDRPVSDRRSLGIVEGVTS